MDIGTLLVVLFVLFIALVVLYTYRDILHDRRYAKQEEYYRKKLEVAQDLYEQDRNGFINRINKLTDKLVDKELREKSLFNDFMEFNNNALGKETKTIVENETPFSGGINKDAFNAERSDKRDKNNN